MQQWTPDSNSESPESNGRPSALSREARLFRTEGRSTRRSTRSEHRRASREVFPTEPFWTLCHNDKGDDEDEEGRHSAPQRLSRHIPQRVGIDMTVSSFNLMASTACGAQTSVGSPLSVSCCGGRDYSRNPYCAAAPTSRYVTPGTTHLSTATATNANGYAAAAAPTPSSSAFTSFSESMVSDDSSYMTSLYNDVLADHLIGHRGGVVTAVNGGSTDDPGATVYTRAILTSGANLSVCESSTAMSDERGVTGLSTAKCGSSLHASADGPVNSARRGLGGEVLRFADTTPAEVTPRSLVTASPTETSSLRLATFSAKGTARVVASTATATTVGAGLSSALPRVRCRTIYTSGSGNRGICGARVFNTTPERVLDAPQFPPKATQLLDWGVNNCIAIGMGQSLYSWSGDSGEAMKVVELDDAVRICCLQWLQKCSCVAISVQDGTTAIFDSRTSSFLRIVRLPPELEVTGLSVKGPVLAVASDGPYGTTCAFDLRAKDALVAIYEGHVGGVTTLHYCAAEPFYLATGGSDGSVRVWDARRASTPRYAFDSVHQGSVNVARWDPQKRSRLFTGGEDGIMCLIDTHAPKRTIEMDTMPDEEVVGFGCSHEHLTQYVTRAVNTQYPISGLVCHGTNGEVLTAHKNKGQLQLRKASTFHLLTTFTALHCDASLSCLTMAPDQERVCAAQADETLKFWRVFEKSTARGGERNGVGCVDQGRKPLHQDLSNFLEEPLR
ncbi:WD domain, G-beta repeat, putative [Leishmania lindenbergi]|uniref:WD domain, G-beta repeat n=1 Tax=Leishmania lindenbergi TaxID=651832 RepID=A0AAW2ZX42_9TRYP